MLTFCLVRGNRMLTFSYTLELQEITGNLPEIYVKVYRKLPVYRELPEIPGNVRENSRRAFT